MSLDANEVNTNIIRHYCKQRIGRAVDTATVITLSGIINISHTYREQYLLYTWEGQW